MNGDVPYAGPKRVEERGNRANRDCRETVIKSQHLTILTCIMVHRKVACKSSIVFEILHYRNLKKQLSSRREVVNKRVPRSALKDGDLAVPQAPWFPSYAERPHKAPLRPVTLRVAFPGAPGTDCEGTCDRVEGSAERAPVVYMPQVAAIAGAFERRASVRRCTRSQNDGERLNTLCAQEPSQHSPKRTPWAPIEINMEEQGEEHRPVPATNSKSVLQALPSKEDL
ncbi:hypothetical protein B0H19DRAFT_1226505 [Mycena capillaripes]|nr:hypothetical protein B0H19DRAFT_1226505 [Mycena capillaripes]